ncbi:polymer-forming cytoskeletal protein [Paenibacillus sp. N1-5-1-14]|uniref:bactofilin family protein n=1 Tax=Paenibacillus radicibacter TaxID=2972488 RepID=UPI0021594BB1|nr:polymer-forming cytoskeletal protein [Paenibacillus radicibacter]MCR8643570.1 polymer-forming cytoskeletal protein [Paenibacillus radicibacter]
MLKKKVHYSGGTPDTIIGEHMICEGKMISELAIRIEGQVHGEIECTNDVTIGEKGNVQANIQARVVIIAGKVKGDIVAREKLIILKSGELNGNANVRTIIIEDGGIFHGICIMQTDAPESQESNEERPHPKLVSSKGKGGQASSENKTATAN